MTSVDGTWRVRIESPMGPREVELRLETEGWSLAGTLFESGNRTDVEGTIDGDELEFVAATPGITGPSLLVFSGHVRAQGLSGAVEFGERGFGTWEAQRLHHR